MSAKKHLYKLIVLPLFLVAAAATASPDNITRIMELSGLNYTLENMPAQINASLKEAGTDNPQGDHVAAIMNESFNPKAMKDIVRAHLEKNLSDRDIKGVLEWLDSPLGKKITALENASSTEQDMANIQQKMPGLIEDNSRFALIRQLDQAINVSESTINTLLVMQKAMLHGAMASAPADLRWDEERIHGYIESLRPQIKAEYELLTIASLAYTYRDLPDSDIQAYIRFANTPAGQHYHAAGIAAMDKAMTAASEKMGIELGKLASATEDNKQSLQ